MILGMSDRFQWQNDGYHAYSARKQEQTAEIDSLLGRSPSWDLESQRQILAKAKALFLGQRFGSGTAYLKAIREKIFPRLAPELLIAEVFESMIDDGHIQEWRRQYSHDVEFLDRHIPENWDTYYTSLLQTTKELLWHRDHPEYAEKLAVRLGKDINAACGSFKVSAIVSLVSALTTIYAGDIGSAILFDRNTDNGAKNILQLRQKAEALFNSIISNSSVPYTLFLFLEQQHDSLLSKIDNYTDVFNEPDDGFERWFMGVTPFLVSESENIYGVQSSIGGYPVLLVTAGEDSEMVQKLLAERELLKAEFEEIREQKAKVLYDYGGDALLLPQPHQDWYRTRTPVEQRMYEIEQEINDKYFTIQHGSLSRLSPREDRVLDFKKYIIDIPGADGEYWAAFFNEKIRKRVFGETGIQLENLPIRDQMYFFAFGLKVGPDYAPRIKSLLKKFGPDSLRTFLATAVDEKAGDEILKLGEWAGADEEKRRQVSPVFSKFCELTDRIDTLEEYIESTFRKSDEQLARQVTRSMLVRAREMIRSAHQAAEGGRLHAVLEDIQDLDARIFVFGKVARALHDAGIDTRQTFREWSRVVNAQSMSEDDRGEVRKLFEAAYASQAGNPDYSSEQVANLRQEIEARFRNPEAEFHLLEDPTTGALFASLCFEPRIGADGRPFLYMSTVMSDASLMGSRVGLTYAEAEISSVAECGGGVIRGICSPLSPVTEKYLEMGFVVRGIAYSSNGKPFYEIELNPSRPVAMRTSRAAGVSLAQIRERAASGVRVPGGAIAYVGPAGKDDLVARLKGLQQREPAWRMTRLVAADRTAALTARRFYAAFERDESLGGQAKTADESHK